MPCLDLHLFVICDAVDETFGKRNDAFLVALAEYAYELCVCVDAVPREHLAFRDTQSRAVNEFKQNAGPHLLERRVFYFREFLGRKVFLPEYVHEPLRAFWHGHVFCRIYFQNFRANQILAKTFECSEMLAKACGGEFLLHLQVPDECLDVRFVQHFNGGVFV